PMLKQIRINKTPMIEQALIVLQSKKYPLLEENEIVKYLISREYNEAIKEIDNNKGDRGKQEIKKILKAIYKDGDKFGKAFLEKKGLKKENLNEEKLYELVANA
ncbi:hypothetical protein CO165_03530, partial [Candidatus Roizmanbacteria bacterium CG_4_9_14_3_um_filter_33_18]